MEVLDDLLRWAPSNVIEQQLSVHGSVLARIAPRLSGGEAVSPVGAQSDGERAHYRLFEAVTDFLVELARSTPLLIVLEDLHWADEPTVLLFKYVVTMPNVDGLAIIGTYRSTDLDDTPLAALLPDLHREPEVLRVELDGLTDGEVIELLQEQSGHPLDEHGQRVARLVRRDTAGNPFFLVQLLQSDGQLSLDDALESVLTDVPSVPLSLRETISARVSRLGHQTAGLLRSAAVAGDEFDTDLLRVITHLSEPDLVSSLDSAIRAQLLVDAQGRGVRLAFVHALVPHVLRSELSAVRRHALHRAVAQGMEVLYGQDGGEHVAALAYHWRLGCDSSTVGRALRFARLAAERAVEQLAPAEAVRWYQDAMELHLQQPKSDPQERCELLIRLGEAQREAGDAAFRETLLEAARLAERLQDTERLVRATLANTRGFTSATGEIDTERVEMLKAAIQAIDTKDSPERARLLAAQAVELAFSEQREKPLELSEQALAMARRCGDDAALARVLASRFFAIWTPDTLSIRLAESEENVLVCERLGDPLAQSQALHWRANACIEAADMVGARKCMRRVKELSNRLREPTVMWLSAYNDANLALALGKLDEAAELTLKALELGQRSGQPDALPVYAAQVSNLRFSQGRLGELIPLIDQILSEHAAITGFRALLALARCEQEDREQAQMAFAYDAGTGFTELSYDVTWLSVVCIYAHVCARLAEVEAARTLYRMLEPWSKQVAVSVVAWGCVAHYLGMLATTLEDFGHADHHFKYASRVHNEMGTPVWSAQTGLESARMLAARRRRGDRLRARGIAEQVRVDAQKLGCRVIARDAGAVLDLLTSDV